MEARLTKGMSVEKDGDSRDKPSLAVGCSVHEAYRRDDWVKWWELDARTGQVPGVNGRRISLAGGQSFGGFFLA